MQDYNINVNYNVSSDVKETNIKSAKTNQKKKTSVKTIRRNNIRAIQKFAGIGIGVASKINNYVGALTENTIQQRNVQTALTFTGLGIASLTNPITASVGAALYSADNLIQYQIKQYKSNLSADFMRSLSGGIYTTRK